MRQAKGRDAQADLTLATLADVRALIDRHMPKEFRDKSTWHVQRSLAGACEPGEVVIALQLVLSLERRGVPAGGALMGSTKSRQQTGSSVAGRHAGSGPAMLLPPSLCELGSGVWRSPRWPLKRTAYKAPSQVLERHSADEKGTAR